MARERWIHVRVLCGSCKICNYGERGWGERKKTSKARRQLEMNARLSGCCSMVTCLLRAVPGSGKAQALLTAHLILLGGTSGAGSRLQCPLSSREPRSQGMRRASLLVREVRDKCVPAQGVFTGGERGVYLPPTHVVRLENRSPFIPDLPQSLTLFLQFPGAKDCYSARGTWRALALTPFV